MYKRKGTADFIVILVLSLICVMSSLQKVEETLFAYKAVMICLFCDKEVINGVLIEQMIYAFYQLLICV